MDDDRPLTDWEARVAKAKRDGTWGTDDEEPSPYPPAERRKRFWLAFGLTLAAVLVVGSVLHVVLGRPGSPLAPGHLLDRLIAGFFPAFFIGWGATRGPRKR